MELPVAGYPISEEAVTNWFEQTHGRLPSERETGAIMDAMAQREASQPVKAPVSDSNGLANRPVCTPGHAQVTRTAQLRTVYWTKV